MNQMRKKFDNEFKKKAVELSYARGNATEIAEELGIERALLYRWRKEFKQYDKNSFPGHGNPKIDYSGESEQYDPGKVNSF